MADENSERPSEPVAPARPAEKERVFLVVVDESEEMQNALHYACRRARNTQGRVALLYVIEPAEFQHWLGVERVMQDEARQHAEQTCRRSPAGSRPNWQATDPACSRRSPAERTAGHDRRGSEHLAVGAGHGDQPRGARAAGHLLVGQMGGQMRVPVTLVPGQLTPEEIDEVT